MSDPNRAKPSREEESEPHFRGPNLVLYFSLIALALAAAIGFAILIVLPFYKTRH
jgi:hypothetical protein